MPISPATVTNAFATQTGVIRLSLLDVNYNNLLAFLNTTLNYSNYVVDTGAADHYVVTFNGGLTFSLTAGQMMLVKITHDSTGACDIAVNGGAAQSIKTQAGADPASAALKANGYYLLAYTSAGTWQLI